MGTENDIISAPKRCFVIMGFGIKTDFATGRKLDLNKSYKLLIKPVVEKKGLICIRADELLYAGSIDYQMYKELLDADLVIADLSTANVNAFYELGVRHALRRRTTIVISEDKYSYPFDLNHIKITSYTHLGEAIDYEEVLRFQDILGDTIDAVLKIDDDDSPVYSFLRELTPPLFQTNTSGGNGFKKDPINSPHRNTGEDEHIIKTVEENTTLSLLIDQGENALQQRNYQVAKSIFHSAVVVYKAESIDDSNQDSYLIQRLAYATYKAKLPDVISALNDSIKLLSKLDLERTNDTETVSLAGRIEKKLFEKGLGDQHLTNTIEFHERCYFLLHNRYHGINLAFLFNKRADSSLDVTNEERIADMIFANRIRRQVLKMCDNDWNEIIDRKNRITKSEKGNTTDLSDYNVEEDNEQMFWIQVNKAECHFCLGEMDEFKLAVARAKEIEHANWMMKAYEKQLAELQTLFRKLGNLLNPPWSES